jgi:hypothetical protein
MLEVPISIGSLMQARKGGTVNRDARQTFALATNLMFGQDAIAASEALECGSQTAEWPCLPLAKALSDEAAWRLRVVGVAATCYCICGPGRRGENYGVAD